MYLFVGVNSYPLWAPHLKYAHECMVLFYLDSCVGVKALEICAYFMLHNLSVLSLFRDMFAASY